MNDRDCKSFQIRRTADALRRATVLDCWRQSVAQTPHASIYLHPDWVLSSPDNDNAVMYLREQRATCDGSLECLAIFRRRFINLGRSPLLPWLLSLSGFSLVRDQLLGKTDEDSTRVFVADLLRWLNSGETKTECILFQDVEVGSALWKCLKAVGLHDAAVYHPSAPQVHCLIEFPDPPAAYWRRFSGKTWSAVRCKARRLKHTLVCYTRSEHVAQFLAKAHEVSRRSWQAKRFGIRLDHTPDGERACRFLAAHGALRCYTLEHEGKPLAFEFGVQWNGRFLFEETGYDLAHARHSPGSVLMLRVLEDLVARDPPSLCDFGAGDAAYKRFYGTRQTLSGPVLLVRRGMRPFAVLRMQKAGRALARSFRACLRTMGLSSYVRGAYRK